MQAAMTVPDKFENSGVYAHDLMSGAHRPLQGGGTAPGNLSRAVVAFVWPDGGNHPSGTVRQPPPNADDASLTHSCPPTSQTLTSLGCAIFCACVLLSHPRGNTPSIAHKHTPGHEAQAGRHLQQQLRPLRHKRGMTRLRLRPGHNLVVQLAI
jgi:hypothetical protein